MSEKNIGMPRESLSGGLIGQLVWHGHEGVRSYLRDLQEAWDDLDYDLEKLIPRDSDRPRSARPDAPHADHLVAPLFPAHL